jgi:hypothetical protein
MGNGNGNENENGNDDKVSQAAPALTSASTA